MNDIRERLKLIRNLIDDDQDETIDRWAKSKTPDETSFLAGKLAGEAFALGLIDFAMQEASDGNSEKSRG